MCEWLFGKTSLWLSWCYVRENWSCLTSFWEEMKLPSILLRVKARKNTRLREAFGEACGDKEHEEGRAESRWLRPGNDQKADGSLIPNWGLCSWTTTSGPFPVDGKWVPFQQRQWIPKWIAQGLCCSLACLLSWLAQSTAWNKRLLGQFCFCL